MLKECHKKMEETNLERYGAKTFAESQKWKDNLQKYLEKRKCSSINKYGSDHYMKTEAWRKRYDSEIKIKTQETCLKVYKCKNSFQSDIVKAKRKNTIKIKYGVDNYSQTVEWKNKQYCTKKQNNSFNTSKPEEEYHQYLINKFGKDDVIRQYKDSRYPFSCDFYIKSEDLFIELNLHWTHGNHLFDKNNKEDLEKLTLWEEKSKHSKFYKKAIEVWTINDVNKQKIAKENNLNYLAIYDITNLYNYG